MKTIFRLLLALTILASVIFVVRFYVGNPSNKNGTTDSESGCISKKENIQKNFDAIEVSGSTDVYIKQQDNFSVEIIAKPKVADNIKVEVEDNTLSVKCKKAYKMSRTAKLIISAPQIRKIKLEGATKLYVEETLLSDSLLLLVQGAAIADIAIKCNSMKTVLSGAGKLKAKGEVQSAISRINGTGNLSAIELKANVHDIKINGAGRASVFATDTLKASINGAGEVEYFGSPHVVPNIKGIGSVKRGDEF